MITTASATAATADAVVVATQSQLPPANRHRDGSGQRTLVSISSSRASTNATGAHPVDERSDSTINSSERSSQQSEDGSESSEETGAFGDEYDEDDDLPTGGDGAQTRYLLKPMPSLLQVCPVDDLAVEDEKRRRRHSRNNNSSSSNHKKRPSADAESLPSAPSPLLLRHHHQQQQASTQTGLAAPSSSSSSGAATTQPLLRRDSMAIRQQYWKQLGFNLTRSDLERTTGRRSVRHKGLKVRLNDDAAAKKGGASKNFFQFIASWYNPTEPTESDASSMPLSSRHSAALASALSPARGRGTSAAARKAIRFDDEAELFYIPLHTDYSKRQRDCMWHTRVEFVAMVERNLEDVYDEMEREYEEQVEAEDLANEQMTQEEARQRKVEAEQLRVLEASRAAAAAAAAAATAAAATRAAAISRATLSPVLRGRSPLLQQLPAAPVPTLALCPSETQIKLAAPRGRSPHAIRFQYLKHLGIPNSKNS